MRRRKMRALGGLGGHPKRGWPPDGFLKEKVRLAGGGPCRIVMSLVFRHVACW